MRIIDRMEGPKLSILITTHNNERQIARCLDSVLAQELNVPYELIVSDDSSTDGTMAILRRYEKEHEGIVHVYSVCSDEIHPTMGLERAGWNKANVYMHAKGEYVVNLDGDDYLKGTDIYQLQIEQLEKHPECVACMQDLWMVNDGDEIKRGWQWGQRDLNTGDVIDFERYVLEHRDVSHPAFTMRRDKDTDMVARYGKFFDDEFNVMHHIQGGKIVYLQRADYVYVQYHKSLNHNYSGYSRDARFLCLPLIYASFWPKHAVLFVKSNLNDMQRYMRRVLQDKSEIQADVKAYLLQFEGWVFRYLSKLSMSGRYRLWMVHQYVLVLNTLKPKSDWPYRVLVRMLI